MLYRIYLQYGCRLTVSRRFLKLLILIVDSTTNAGRSFHGEKTIFTKHAFLALTHADCLKSLNLWPLVTELHGNMNN